MKSAEKGFFHHGTVKGLGKENTKQAPMVSIAIRNG
jgi:hypothetical protein